MIRLGDAGDIEKIIELVRSVYEPFLEKYGIPMNEENLRHTTAMLVKLKQTLVVEHDREEDETRFNKTVVGVAAWGIVPHPANNSCKIFQEILWCIKGGQPMDALALLRAIEDKARELKADIIVLANLSLENESKLRKIYNRRGYEYMETHYSKALK